jgi:hypothetical protein
MLIHKTVNNFEYHIKIPFHSHLLYYKDMIYCNHVSDGKVYIEHYEVFPAASTLNSKLVESPTSASTFYVWS